jgi:integrase
MPYKRPGSEFYYCRRKRLVGYGDTGAITSRTRNRRVAEKMEALLDDLAARSLVEPRWKKLIDAVLARQLTLPQLMEAHRDKTLTALMRSLSDPLLSDVLARYRQQKIVSRQHEIGLAKLEEYVPVGVRFSYLFEGKHITDLLLRYEREGTKRNSVVRQMKQAISGLLRHELGRAERDRIFGDVDFARTDDTREVTLSPEEIGSLLASCRRRGYDELSTLVRVALLTSADRGVLLAGPRPDGAGEGLLCRAVRIYEENGLYSGELELNDSKTETRARTVPFADSLARELLALVRGKHPGETVFQMQYLQLDPLWYEVRADIGRSDLRFKDLRAVCSHYAEEANIPQTVVTSTMGHDDVAMTRRYQRRRAQMTMEQAADLERAMFGRRTG